MDFTAEVESTAGGENIRACIQCGICAGSCPVADRMEYPPRRIIALIRAGKRDEVLRSGSMWYCLSCYMCAQRCPRDVNPTGLAYALDSLAFKYDYRVKDTHTPEAHYSFARSLLDRGRIYELGMILRYYRKIGIIRALKMLPLALNLFRHGRLPLMPPRVKDKQQVKRVIAAFRRARGEK